jgi:hypothetical protein
LTEVDVNKFLDSLNTHAIGYVSLGVGTASFATLVRLFTDPTYLVALYGAIIRGTQHLETQVDVFVFAQLVAALFGIVASIIGAYFSRPKNIASDPK